MALCNNVNDAIYVNKLCEDGTISGYVYVNDVGCRRLGYTRGEMTSLTVYNTTPDLTPEKLSELLDTISEKGNALYKLILKPNTKE